MKIGITGATGFLGRYLVREFAKRGDVCRCWHRPTSDRGGFDDVEDKIEWVQGELGDDSANRELVQGCDGIVHAALFWDDSNLPTYAEKNIVGTIRLTEAAREAGVQRFVFIATGAVHNRILDDRPLDEAHPLWPYSHYGAMKAAIEKFVHSYGMGDGYGINSLRPVGIYGLARPVQRSKWYDLVHKVKKGETVECGKGGKEVHAADVARAAAIVLEKGEPGEAYNCFDLYVSDWDIANLAKEITGSNAKIEGSQTRPKHMIETGKIRSLGMEFGGEALLKKTIRQMLIE